MPPDILFNQEFQTTPKVSIRHLRDLLQLFALAGVTLLLSSNGVAAQASVFLGPVETTHLGRFDAALSATMFGGGGSSPSGVGELMQIILPDGRLPADLRWAFDPRPGIEAGATFDVDLPLISRIEAYVLYDTTNLLLTAPTGFGILADPTTLEVDASLFGAGFVASTELAAGQSMGLDWRVLLGGGATAYRSETRMRAKSDFLDIDETTVDYRIAPLAALSVEASHERTSGSIAIRAFPTDDFVTASISARLGLSF